MDKMLAISLYLAVVSVAMKSLICTFIVLAVASLVTCQYGYLDSSDLSKVRLNYMKDYLREKQAITNLTNRVETFCPGSRRKLETALDSSKTCYNAIDEAQETACSLIRNHFERCSGPIIKFFENCLPSEANDMPSFVVKAIASATDYLCKTDGEHIFELANPCILAPSFKSRRCVNRVQTKVQQMKDKIPTKADLCDFITSFRPCMEMHLEDDCGNEITRQSAIGFFNAFASQCRKNESFNEIEIIDMAAD